MLTALGIILDMVPQGMPPPPGKSPRVLDVLVHSSVFTEKSLLLGSQMRKQRLGIMPEPSARKKLRKDFVVLIVCCVGRGLGEGVYFYVIINLGLITMLAGLPSCLLVVSYLTPVKAQRLQRLFN